MKTVLTIGGSDPSAEAGIQVDLQVFNSLKVRGISSITAITAQNDERFYSLNPIPSTLLREQLRSVVGRYRPDVVKVGLLGTVENVMAVCRFLEKENIDQVVLDPVFKSSTDAVLLVPKGVAILKDFLIPKVLVVTPNLSEAEALTGLKVTSLDEMKEAAAHIYSNSKGVKAVLIKGGHLKDQATDLLFDGTDSKIFTSKTKYSKHVHGTGCVFSAALASHIARGEPLDRATKLAKTFVTDWIRRHNKDFASPAPEPVLKTAQIF
jgi:hydroxymethylpyrimidine/phosphomethylpyrimidine kinase